MGLRTKLLLFLLFPSILHAKCYNSDPPVELILCWEAQEGAGTKINDYSVYNTSGEIQGAIAWVPGVKPNRTKAFSNVSSYTVTDLGDYALSHPAAANTGIKSKKTALFNFVSKNFMVGYNFKLLNYPIGGNRAFLWYYSDIGAVDGWGLAFAAQGNFTYYQTGVAHLDNFGTFSDANPHRFFFIRVQTTGKIYGYIDGVPFSDNPFSLAADNPSATGFLSVGYSGAANGNRFDGTWNTLAIYNNIPLNSTGGVDKNKLNEFAEKEYRSVMGYDSGDSK